MFTTTKNFKRQGGNNCFSFSVRYIDCSFWKPHKIVFFFSLTNPQLLLEFRLQGRLQALQRNAPSSVAWRPWKRLRMGLSPSGQTICWHIKKCIQKFLTRSETKYNCCYGNLCCWETGHKLNHWHMSSLWYVKNRILPSHGIFLFKAHTLRHFICHLKSPIGVNTNCLLLSSNCPYHFFCDVPWWVFVVSVSGLLFEMESKLFHSKKIIENENLRWFTPWYVEFLFQQNTTENKVKIIEGNPRTGIASEYRPA